MNVSEPEHQELPELDGSVSPPVRKLRWKWGLGILLLGIAAIIYRWFQLAPDRTYQVFSVYSGTLYLLIGMLIWWMLISGVAWKMRFKGLLGTVLLFGLFFALFRVESFEGDMVPRFRFRFLPTSEQRAEQYFEQIENSAPAANVELTEQTLEVSPDDWPAFRGAERDGVVRDQTIRTDWKQNPPELLWKHPVGAGWGSFCVIGDRAFTQEQRGEQETVVCYDVLSGEQIWTHADPVRFSETLGGVGPRATPTFQDGLLFTMGGTGILNCLNAGTGERVWSHDLLKEGGLKNLEWGMAGSPLIWEDLVIVNQGIQKSESKAENQSLIAFDRLSGEKVWSGGTRKSSYSSPQFVVLNETSQVLVFHSKGLESFAPQDGTSLWFFPWTNQAGINAAQAIVVDDRSLFLGTGYGKGSTRLRINPSENSDAKVTQDWKSQSMKLKFNSAVQRDGFVFGLDEGVLTCLNLETGKRNWKRGRYGYGQILLVGSHLLILAEDGHIELVKADPEQYEQVAEFQAIEGQTWNHPALVRGKLFVRNSEEAACYELKPVSK